MVTLGRCGSLDAGAAQNFMIESQVEMRKAGNRLVILPWQSFVLNGP